MRKVVEHSDEATFQADLEKYRRLALSSGATDARIIRSDEVMVDERVPLKCAYPKCASWGRSIHCPPHAMTPEQTKRVVGKYRYGILYTRECPTELWLGDNIDLVKRRRSQRETYEINAKVESAAFYDGYHLAMGFWNGSCKSVFCPDIDCSALEVGKGCRAPLKARSSMESIGIDPMMMAARMGWDIYACGSNVKPGDVPYVRFLGLVLID